MGNCWNPVYKGKRFDSDPANPEDQVEQKEENNEETKVEKAPANVFSIISDGHAVIRGIMTDIGKFIEAEDLEKATEAYRDLEKWEGIHRLMYDGYGDNQTPKGLFCIMDENFGNLAKEFGLSDGHKELAGVEKGVEEAIAAKDLEQFKTAFAEFQKADEALLKKKEKLIMPKIKHMKISGVDMTELMTYEILALAIETPDMEFFIKHATSVLDKHYAKDHLAREFSHALSDCSTPEQWETWWGWIKESASTETFTEIVDITG